MATKYVTLKDSNGDTLYPQAVATNLAPGSIDTTEIANGAVTAAKVDWSTVKAASVSLTDFADATTGFSILNGSVWQFSNIVFGNILVQKNSGYYGAQEVALTVKSDFRPAEIWNSYCAMSGSEWGSDYVGYAYTAVNGKIWLNCMSNASCNVAKIRFFWVKA